MAETDAPDSPEPSSGAVGDHPIVTPLRIGVVTMLIGALLVGGAVLATTSASPQPECPAGTVLVSKFNFDGANYVFEQPAGNDAAVTITGGTAVGGNWASTQPIAAVVVKGGPGSATATYEPPATGGSFSNADLPPAEQGIPNITNIQFCAPDVAPQSSTTTTVKPSGNLTSLCEWDSLNYWRVTVTDGGVFRLNVHGSPVVVDLGLLAPGTYGVEAFEDGQKITTPATPGADTTKLQALIDGRWRNIKTKAANTKPCPQPTTTTSTSTTSTTTTTSSTTSTTEQPTTTDTTSSTSTSTSTSSTTTTTEQPTSSTSSSTTTTEAPTTTGSTPTTSEGTTSTPTTTTATGGEQVSGEVASASVTRVEVTEDDARANRSGAALAFTGGNTSLLAVIGIILLLGGASLAAVSYRRQRHAGT